MRMTPVVLLLAVAISIGEQPASFATETAAKPNVIIIVTDDHGFGELGTTGNPVIRTPAIDRMASQSVSLTNYCVMPVCSPTRACLMTGRYNYRTGVIDTRRRFLHFRESEYAEKGSNQHRFF